MWWTCARVVISRSVMLSLDVAHVVKIYLRCRFLAVAQEHRSGDVSGKGAGRVRFGRFGMRGVSSPPALVCFGYVSQRHLKSDAKNTHRPSR